jgi:hypoxanthine-DNA glycosylase
MSTIKGFPPIGSTSARVLILGSMPGVKSLDAEQYYAHPRNAFWFIMEGLFGFNAEGPYEERLESLIENRIALWDVLQTCHRPGSLDTSIDEESIVVNDFASFLQRHPGIHAIFFNGGKAEQLYRKYIAPELPEDMRDLFMQRLPSTSPANARLTLEEKTEQWRVVYDYTHES